MNRDFRLLACFLIVLSGCALRPGWHWEKRGASAADYDLDVKVCKVQNQAPIDGSVTQESVRRLHACMEGKGWRKVID